MTNTSMKMAVFSDSHGNYRLLGQALATSRSLGAEIFVHLGDYYDDLSHFDCTGHTVHRVPGLPGTDSVAPYVEKCATFSFGGLQVLAVHDLDTLQPQGREGLLILYGHTHKAESFLGKDGAWYLNPGHLKAEFDRGAEPSFALIRHTAAGGESISEMFSPEGKPIFSCSIAFR